MHSLTVILALLCLASCDSLSPVPSGQIRFKNDLSGDEFSTISVTSSGGSYVLKAGEWALFARGTTSFSVQYQGEHKYAQYRVECPAQIGRGITVRLIDIHTNRISGGCKTVWSNGA